MPQGYNWKILIHTLIGIGFANVAKVSSSSSCLGKMGEHMLPVTNIKSLPVEQLL